MGNQLFITLAPVFLILTVFCLSIVARYRKEPVARPLVMYLGLVIWLLVTSSCELLFPSHESKIFFSKLEYISFMLVPPSLFLFSLRYTGYVKFTRYPINILVFLIPVLSLAAVWTNELHGLFWQEIGFPVESSFSEMHAKYGVFFWLAISWVYLLIGCGMITILRSYLWGPGLFRRQSLTIVAGFLVPGALNSIYVLKLVPPGFKDFTPMGLAVTGILLSAGIYLNRFLKILPVARTVILDELETGVILLNRNGVLIDLNRAASVRTGLGNADIGVAAESLPAVTGLLGRQGLRFPLEESDEIRRIGELSLSIRVRMLRGGWDRGAGYVITINDITEQIRQIEELSQLREQMVQSEKLAMIGQIATGVAHEINNPLEYLTGEFRSLRAINENVGSLDPEWIRDNLKEIITVAESGLGRIESVVKHLLEFAKKGAGSNEYEVYDLNQGIMSTLEICRSEYRSYARVELDLGTIPVIRSRKNEINQVVLNIVTNAARAIRRSPVNPQNLCRIRIRTFGQGNAVVCEISNNGPAIPEELRERIFDMFFTTARDSGGTGLGLSISREIVEKRHGGKLELVSACPVMFRMTLPVL